MIAFDAYLLDAGVLLEDVVGLEDGDHLRLEHVGVEEAAHLLEDLVLRLKSAIALRA